MQWQPSPGKQRLAPFGHQVAGQSSMLCFDSTTVCKPLIAREHFVYQKLPTQLKDFTPEYRGVIEVTMQEDNGYIQLYGNPIELDLCDTFTCACAESEEEQTDEDLQSAVQNTDDLYEKSSEKKCVIRVLRSNSYEVHNNSEEVFYTSSNSTLKQKLQNLNPWSLKNHKRLLDKMRKSDHSHNKFRFILLKNVVAGFIYPCILDLKIGSRLHGDDASAKKVVSQSKKCQETTSSLLGVRLCGMQVYQVEDGVYKSYDKFYGRTLNQHSFKDMLYEFLHNGHRFRSELLRPIILQLKQLINQLETLSSYRFYASSLLIIYDGNIKNNNGNATNLLSLKQSNMSTCSSFKASAQMPESGSLGEMSKVKCASEGLFSKSTPVPSYSLHTSSVKSSDPLDSSDNVKSTVKTPLKNDNYLSEEGCELQLINQCTNLSVTSKTFPHSNFINNREKLFQSNDAESLKEDCEFFPDSDDSLRQSPCSKTETFQKSYENEMTDTVKFDIKMIDFAHTTHSGFIHDVQKHTGPDQDYINGLKNLRTLFKQLHAESMIT